MAGQPLMPHVTFVTHDASATGAPYVLLGLMRWLCKNTDLRLTTLAVQPGPLLEEFGRLGPVSVLGADSSERTETDLVYANCLESTPGVMAVRRGQPLVAHLHEGDDYLLADTYQHYVDALCRSANRIIASSSGVRKLLLEKVGIPNEAVTVCYPFIDPEACLRAAAEAPDARSRLGIPEDALVVGMCGWASWKKAPDVFVTVARAVLKRARQPVVCVWIGGDPGSPAYRYPARDVDRLGLAQQIRFLPHQKNPLPYLRMFDVLFLSSRADVFPLVCLEAAVVGKTPIVCFEGAGDMTELVADGGGYVVPYMDIDEATAAVLDLISNDTVRARMGDRAAEIVMQRHDIGKAAPRIYAVIRELL